MRCLRPLGVAGAMLVVTLCSGCLLTNIGPDDCDGDAACVTAFGLGSTCGDDGYCVEPPVCSSSVQCRSRHGFGASCLEGRCQPAVIDPRCTLSEPEGLLTELAGLSGDRVVLGGLFAYEQEEKFLVRATATRLGIREINQVAQGIGGRELGILICNNNSDGDSSNDSEETAELTRFLAGSLGVPVIVGPTASSLSVTATNTLIEDRLATVIISPSATSNQLSEQDDRLDPEDPYGLFWRTCPSDALQSVVLARIISGTQPGISTPDTYDNVAVIFQNDTYGNGLQQGFRSAFTEISPGVHEVSGFSFDKDDAASITNAVSNAAGSNPQTVLVVASSAGTVVAVLEEAAGTSLASLPHFFSDGAKDATTLLSSSNAQAVKDMVKNAFGTTAAGPSGPLYDAFKDELHNQFNADASQFSFIAHSYDALYTGAFGIVAALEASPEFDGRHVAAGLARLSAGDAVAIGPTDFQLAVNALSTPDGTVDIAGTSGSLNFDAALGEAPGDIQVWWVCHPPPGGTDTCTGTPVAGADYVFDTLLTVPATEL